VGNSIVDVSRMLVRAEGGSSLCLRDVDPDVALWGLFYL
jgi:hypothetical protein